MTGGFDSALLAELDRLVDRFGPRSVTSLSELIRDPRMAEELADAMELAAYRAQHRRSRSRSKSGKADRIGISVLRELRDSDPEKHSLIAEIRSYLISGTILRSMAELRRFAREHDFAIGKASSRTAAIVPLLRSISELSTPEVSSLRDSIVHSDASDRSLERWRNVIVKPRGVKNAENMTAR